MDRQIFKEKLTFYRKAKGMTQRELAEILHVSSSTISKWENGEAFPDLDMLSTIAGIFQVPFDEFVGASNLKTKGDTAIKDKRSMGVSKALIWLVVLWIGLSLLYILFSHAQIGSFSNNGDIEQVYTYIAHKDIGFYKMKMYKDILRIILALFPIGCVGYILAKKYLKDVGVSKK